MAGTAQRTEHLFVVRMWHEADDRAEPAWRGSVEHAGSRTLLYFSGLDALGSFIREQITRVSAESR